MRHELVDGVIRAMAQPSKAHDTIVVNAAAFLRSALGDRPGRPQALAGIRIDEHNWYRADLAVTCAPSGRAGEVDRPLLILEVLSSATRTHDLGRKLNAYKAVPSVQEVWAIDGERRWLQLWQRREQGWVGQDLVGTTSFLSRVPDALVALDEIYAGSGL